MSEQEQPNEQPIPEIKAVQKGGGYRSPILNSEDTPLGEYTTPIFLGSLDSQHKAIFETAVVFAELRQMRQDNAAERGVSSQMLNSLEVKYDELREKHFPGIDEKELGITLANYFNFIQRGERTLRRDENRDLLDAGRFSNVFDRPAGPAGVIEKTTVKTVKDKGIRDRMRRSVLKAMGACDSITVTLPNSRIVLRIPVPTPWEMASLFNKISTALNYNQFGGRIRVSSLHLERAMITRTIVMWVLERANYWSVKDILEAEELLEVIQREDADLIATAILTSAAPKGLSYRLHCLADKCNYVEDKLIDPANLVVFDDIRYPQVYMDQVLEMLNTGKKFTKQELKETRVPYVDVNGEVLDDKIVAVGGEIEFKIGSPYLSDYFTCFDHAANLLNKEIRDLATQFPNAKEFAEKRKELMSSMRMIDYLQYFESMTLKADPLNEEEKDEVISRSENPGEFNQGLIDIFNNDEVLYGEALTKVLTIVPRMSYSFVGIADDTCPKCKEKHPHTEIRNGFTPIDPILNFFDQARMLIMVRRDMGVYQEEVLS